MRHPRIFGCSQEFGGCCRRRPTHTKELIGSQGQPRTVLRNAGNSAGARTRFCQGWADASVDMQTVSEPALEELPCLQDSGIRSDLSGDDFQHTFLLRNLLSDNSPEPSHIPLRTSTFVRLGRWRPSYGFGGATCRASRPPFTGWDPRAQPTPDEPGMR